MNFVSNAQNSVRICSISFISGDSVEIVFNKTTDSSLIGQIKNYQLLHKAMPQDSWSLRQSLNKDSLSVFYDTISNKNDSNYYKIVAIDSGGIVIDSSVNASHIHFVILTDTVQKKIDVTVCSPVGIGCGQLYLIQETNGVIDTVISLAGGTPFCPSFVLFFNNGVNSNFYFIGTLNNPCVASYRLTSNTSINSDTKKVYISPPPIPLTPLAYYPLNGNLSDSLGLQPSGTQNGCSWTQDLYGNSNSAIHLDGINDWIEFSSSPIINNQTFTISAWIKLEKHQDINPIISLGYDGSSNNSNEISFGSYKFNNTVSALYTGNNSNKRIEQSPVFPLSTPINIDTTNWYHVVLVYNDSLGSPWTNVNSYAGYAELYYKFYINGTQVSHPGNPSTWINNPFNSSSAFPLLNSMAFGISKGEGTSNKYFSGSIDEIKIFSGALDSVSINSLYQSYFTGINELNFNKINIYPNPSSGNFTINSEENSEKTCEIFNINGQLIFYEIFNTNLYINNKFSPGTYNITIKEKSRIINKKITIF